jgi:signal transduction histidine kinase
LHGQGLIHKDIKPSNILVSPATAGLAYGFGIASRLPPTASRERARRRCLRKLGHDKADLDEVRSALTRLERDAQRAADILARIRSQFQKSAPKQQTLDVNEIILETIALLRDRAMRYNISVRTELAPDLPQIVGDRVQLQQVAMNLIVNSIEAMKDVDGIRELVIRSQRAGNSEILISFRDTGMGLPPQLAGKNTNAKV